MKIEKLYTLSQFIEYLYNEFPLDQHGSINAHKADRFDSIVNYMQFLKQPLKKEIFVNTVDTMHYNKKDKAEFLSGKRMKVWQEAEKRVIFVSFSYVKKCAIRGGNVLNNYNCYDAYKTLHDLAEATNGELKLKNVEL